MKLDIDYIERILGAVEDHPHARMGQATLLQAIGADRDCEADVDTFYFHMRRLSEAGFLFSAHVGRYRNDGFGFIHDPQQGIGLLETEYEMTWDGQRYLEALRSDTIGERARQLFLEMSLDQFKQKFPALISTLIKFGGE